MITGKKKRLSMLDTMATATAPSNVMMSTNRALRAARDAVDAHRVWELDPDSITDERVSDRLDPGDLAELRVSIETNGQAVPILVRRDPSDADRYLLVYGRRRLEAVRGSEKIGKIRALIAHMDEDDAVRAQVAENSARQDLSFIERALFARELVANGFGTQTQVAEVLNVTKSMISMLLSIADQIGPELARAIGPAPGVGRPKWEALAADVKEADLSIDELISLANDARSAATGSDPSIHAFEVVSQHVKGAKTLPRRSAAKARPLKVSGKTVATCARTKSGVRLDLRGDVAFSNWLETEAQSLVEELQARWLAQTQTRG